MSQKRLLFSVLFVWVVVTMARPVFGKTVTLQQGSDGYSGCTTRTIVDTWPSRDADDGYFHLRGSSVSLHVKFDLPKLEAPLARARVRVFLPECRKPNKMTEIFCHEVISGGRQPSYDEVADYDNGRRKGAVDSVELFAPPHEGWPDFPFLPPGLPPGGKWLEFNVTALVEKWLAGDAANHGVMLIPTDCPDAKFPSTWEIDIPAATCKDKPQFRPQLVLETAPLEQDVLVGVTDGLRRICDRSTRYAYLTGFEPKGAATTAPASGPAAAPAPGTQPGEAKGPSGAPVDLPPSRGPVGPPYGTDYRLSMAANEFEGFQVVLYPMLSELKNVRLEFSDLAGPDGKKIPAGDLECFLEDVYQLRRNWMTKGLMFAGKIYDIVDPLIPAKPVTIKRHIHTPFYVNVRTRAETAAGVYKGKITVTAEKAKPVELTLEVNVWPFAIPQKWNFHTMGQFIWGNVGRFHGADAKDQLYRKYYDFLLDHRFSPTEQYGRILSPRMQMEQCLSRGMNTIYLSGNFTGTEAEIAQLKKDVQAVGKLGGLDHALVYIGDETSEWEKMRRSANLVHAHLPGALVMIGGSFPREELTGYIDIYDPQIGGGSKVYSLQQENSNLIAESQKRGEEFYWYVAAGPEYPHPNVQPEYPLVASRVLFWMTWKYGVTGFEYYCYNIWERNYPADPVKRYPSGKWLADGWSKGWPSNGDGMLFYPGPISSLRFEAMRDGIEDWEMLLVLRDCVEALRGRKNPQRFTALIRRAETLLKVREDVVAGFTKYTLDPDRLLEERQAVGDLIAKMAPLADKLEEYDGGQMTLAKAVEVRIAKQTAARRKMLRQRHLEASKALNVEPLGQGAWDALWPKRVLFTQDFEDPNLDKSKYLGKIVTDNVPQGGKRALAGDDKNKYFARHAAAVIHFDNARAATQTWLKFKYFISKDTPIGLMAFDMKHGDNFAGTLAKPTVGKWAEATLDLKDFRPKSGGGRKIDPGNPIDDLFFSAGQPGQELELIIDDVQLIGLD